MSESSPISSAAAGGDYVVVARRYRPQRFDELIGQEHVAKALTGAIASDRVGHAYLFTGARGVGKTSAARILAKALNCVQGPTGTPCNDCEICRSVATGDDVDVLEIDGASNRGIDEIRQLRQNVAVRPSRARFKIYIIDEVHMLTKEAFNALLKTLEEPPEHVKFIFATTEPIKIPITILSRCQRYDFAGIDALAIRERLAQIAASEGVEVEQEALQIIATRAAGSMRDSQSLLEQLLATGAQRIVAGDVTELLGLAPATRLSRIVQPLVEHNAAAALAELDEALADGAEVGQLIDQLLGYFRDAMTQAVGCDENRMLHALPGQRDEVQQVAQRLGVQTLLAISQILDQTAARLRLSTQVRTLAEMAIVRICHLEDLDALATLVEQLKSGQVGALPQGSQGSAAATAPPRPQRPIAAKAPSNASSGDRTAEPARPPVAAGEASPRHPAAEAPRTQTSPPTASLATAANTAGAPQPPAPVTIGEGAVAATVATAAPPVAIDSADAESLWKQMLEQLTGLLADNAAEATQVSINDQGQFVASFPQSRAFCRDACLRASNLAKLEAALIQVCGKTVRVVLETHADPDANPQATAPVKSRRQRQAEISAEPFVQRAMELFDVDPSRLRYSPPEQQ